MGRYVKKKGSVPNIKHCPKCGEELSKVIYGRVPADKAKRLKDQGGKYCFGGCVCFGDERDAKYICPGCNIRYSKDLAPLELMTCPLEASCSIIKGDCVGGELKTKRGYYSFLKNKDVVCKMICPNMDKEVEISTKDKRRIRGKIQRTFKTTVSCPGEHVSLIQELGDYKYEYENVLLSEIVSMKVL